MALSGAKESSIFAQALEKLGIEFQIRPLPSISYDDTIKLFGELADIKDYEKELVKYMIQKANEAGNDLEKIKEISAEFIHKSWDHMANCIQGKFMLCLLFMRLNLQTYYFTQFTQHRLVELTTL